MFDDHGGTPDVLNDVIGQFGRFHRAVPCAHEESRGPNGTAHPQVRVLVANDEGPGE
jgi:hypothetical protein